MQRSEDSVFSTVTGLRTGQLKNGVLIPGGSKGFFSSPVFSAWLWDLLSLLCSGSQGAFSPRVKWHGYKSGHLPQSIVEVNCAWCYTLLFHTFLWHGLSDHRNNFTFVTLVFSDHLAFAWKILMWTEQEDVPGLLIFHLWVSSDPHPHWPFLCLSFHYFSSVLEDSNSVTDSLFFIMYKHCIRKVKTKNFPFAWWSKYWRCMGKWKSSSTNS